MRKLIISTFLLLISNFTFSQADPKVSRIIDSIVSVDQKWRSMFTKIQNGEIDSISLDRVIMKMKATDSLNLFFLRQIFKQYGFPGYNLIGKESSHNFWLLMQHADNFPSFQDSVLSKMKVELEKANASQSDYAYLVDRVKVNEGQLQIYGTQMMLNSDSTSFLPKPVLSPEKLNERRAEMGLPSIERYIKIMNDHFHGALKK
jgi:hypothetical protein